MQHLTLELHHAGRWHRAAEVRLRGRAGERSEPTWLEYDLDYASEHVGRADLAALSVRVPVDFRLHDGSTLPAFLVDALPQGEGRRLCEARLRREGRPTSDWHVLAAGAGSPVGNLRVAEAVAPETDPAGIRWEEVLARGDAFHAWAEEQGVPMHGATDTAGAGPKLLLTEDAEGLVHADGVLPDELARRHWLVKFPRGRTSRDHLVLASEAPWLELARRLGLRCGGPLHHRDGVLRVPRFDREVVHTGVRRWGLESLHALVGEVRAGARLAYEDVCETLAAHVDDPVDELVELVARDAVRLALADPDNHGRNTALWRREGGIALAPLYDLAPMVLDPEGIRRATRWQGEDHAGPDWSQVVATLAHLVPPATLAGRLVELGRALHQVPAWMAELEVDPTVREVVEPHLARTRQRLLELEEGRWDA